MIVKFT